MSWFSFFFRFLFFLFPLFCFSSGPYPRCGPFPITISRDMTFYFFPYPFSFHGKACLCSDRYQLKSLCLQKCTNDYFFRTLTSMSILVSSQVKKSPMKNIYTHPTLTNHLGISKYIISQFLLFLPHHPSTKTQIISTPFLITTKTNTQTPFARPHLLTYLSIHSTLLRTTKDPLYTFYLPSVYLSTYPITHLLVY